MTITADKLISVIICTHRRPSSVGLALESFARSRNSQLIGEIIIVENDEMASSELAEVIKKYARQLPLEHLLVEQPNLSRARNAGAFKAQGKYVAYLDDDVEVTDDWAPALIEGIHSFEPDICGGPAYPLYRSPKPVWFKDAYTPQFYYGSEVRPLDKTKRESFAGMNFIVRRDLVLQQGFREDLAMAGKRMVYGDDTEFLWTAWRMNPNLKVIYFPQAAVKHEVRPEKMTLKWNVQCCLASGRDYAKMQGDLPSFPRRLYLFGANLFWFLRTGGTVFGHMVAGFLLPKRRPWQQRFMELMRDPIFWLSETWHALLTRRQKMR